MAHFRSRWLYCFHAACRLMWRQRAISAHETWKVRSLATNFRPELFEVAHAPSEAAELVDERSDSDFLGRWPVLILFGLVQFAGEGRRNGHIVNHS